MILVGSLAVAVVAIAVILIFLSPKPPEGGSNA